MNECITISERKIALTQTEELGRGASFSCLVVGRMFLLEHSRNLSMRTVKIQYSLSL